MSPNWLQAIILQTEPSQQQPGGFISFLPMFVMIFLVMYFLMIRPQQKREKERKQMLGTMRKNDRVLTTGGILGTVVNLRDDEVTLKIDETNNIRVRFSRDSIVRVIRADAELSEAGPAKS